MEHCFEVIRNRSGELAISGGIEGRFLEMLSKYVGFQYQIVIPPDEEWGVEKPDGSWSGIVGMVNKGDLDLGLGYLVITEERNKAVKFSTPYSIADKTFITNPPKTVPLTSAFFRPFSLDVWIGCMITLLIFPMILRIVVSSSKATYSDLFFRTFGTFCKQPVHLLDRGSTQLKFIFGFWIIFVTVITLSYSGVLPSFLAVPLKGRHIDTILALYKELQDNRDFRCLAPKGSSELDVLLHSSNFEAKRIGEYIKDNNWFYDLTNGTLADQLHEGAALLGLRLWFTSPDFLGKILSRESFGVWNVGIALKSNFCCKRKLNKIILRIQSAGLFNKLISDEFFQTKLHFMTASRNKFIHRVHALTMEDLQGSFLLIVFGNVAAFFCLLVELSFKFLRSRCIRICHHISPFARSIKY